jgi:hypothetical protein
VLAAAAVIAAARPDILVLTGFDWDLDLLALAAFNALLAQRGAGFDHRVALRPNTGLMTDADLDGDGRLRGPGDAQGWGRFSGEGGMAVLSRLPIERDRVRDLSALLWRDLPGNQIAGAGLSPEAAGLQRLSATGHWIVPVRLPDGRDLTLMAWHATPPVFDGPEDRNGRRNHDETALWLRLLDGDLDMPPPGPPFVILGDANLDPADGDGRAAALRALLSDPRLTDPRPVSDGGRAAAAAGHKGDPARDTADWPETDDSGKPGPGNLRVDYVLPSAGLAVTASGVWWPAPGDPAAAEAALASRHRLVWVDVKLD